jgi:integrase
MIPLKKDRPVKFKIRDKVPSPKQLMMFLRYGIAPQEHKFRVMLLCMLGFRCRVGEVCHLNISDCVDPKNNKFRRWYMIIQKKKDNVIEEKTLPESIAAILRLWIFENKERIKDKGGYIFPSTNTRSKMTTPPQVQRWFCKKRIQLFMDDPKMWGFMVKEIGFTIVKKRYNINKKTYDYDVKFPRYMMSSHTMKRFAGTMLYDLTKDPMFVKDMLSHEDLRVTEKHYITQSEFLNKEELEINKAFDMGFYEQLTESLDITIPAVWEKNKQYD